MSKKILRIKKYK